jgi:hypothetical protein
MRPFHPDDSGMIMRDPKNDPRQNQGGGGGGLLGAFLPGQRGMLAHQLAQGFGGNPGAFADQLRQMYKPTFTPSAFQNMGGGFGNMTQGGTVMQPGVKYIKRPDGTLIPITGQLDEATILRGG